MFEHKEGCDFYYFPPPKGRRLYTLPCNCISSHDKVVLKCIDRVATGQVANNLGHDPNLRRALQWIIAELHELKEVHW